VHDDRPMEGNVTYRTVEDASLARPGDG